MTKQMQVQSSEELNRQERIKYWSKVLKELRTWEEFKDFYQKLKDEEFCLEGKRRGIEVFAFHHKYHEDYPFEPHRNRVTYLYDDTVSRGACEISNLYKVVKIAE